MGLTPFRGHRLSGLEGRGDGPVLEGYRADLAERGVASTAVVDGLGPGADRGDCLGSGGEGVSVVEIGLQRGPEALLLGVVPAHPGAPDRQTQVEFFGDVSELAGGVLTAAVRMEGDLGGGAGGRGAEGDCAP